MIYPRDSARTAPRSVLFSILQARVNRGFLRPLGSGYPGDRKRVKRMRPYPIFLKLRGHRCVVVGGGPVAERKAKALVASGARVRLISPQATPSLVRLASQKKIDLARRGYRTGDLKGAFLVFAATNDRETQQAVLREARRVRALANVADDPTDSDFLVPARFSEGGVQVALSTGGDSPALAKRLRQQLQRLLGKDFSARLTSLGKMRRKVKGRIPEQPRRAQTHLNLAKRTLREKFSARR